MSPFRTVLVAALVASFVQPSVAQDAAPPPAAGEKPGDLFFPRFTQTDGRAVYEAICQGCHMSDGKGATGAATYPSLARNRRLAAKAFPIVRVLDGSKGMPPLKEYLSDDQVVAVVTYVRTHFGNAYRDKVSAKDVQTLRK